MEILNRPISGREVYEDWQEPCSEFEPFLKAPTLPVEAWVQSRGIHYDVLLVTDDPWHNPTPLLLPPVRESTVTHPESESDLFASEQAWIELHRHELAGKWVALQGSRLLATGESAKSVYRRARQLGIQRPLVVKIESPDQPPFAGW